MLWKWKGDKKEHLEDEIDHLKMTSAELKRFDRRRRARAESWTPPKLEWEQAHSKLSVTPLWLLDRASQLQVEMLIEQMSEAELLQAIDDLMIGDLNEYDRRELLTRLVDRLSKVNPIEALQKSISLAGQIAEEGTPGTCYISQSFGHWMQSDSKNAIAWLDEQLRTQELFAHPSLRGEDLRMGLETAVIQEFLKKETALAQERLDLLSPGQRQSVLSSVRPRPSRDQDHELMEFYRKNIPNTSVSTIATMVEGLVRREGFERVDSFLSNIAASEEERLVSVKAAIKHSSYNARRKSSVPTREHIAEIHNWVSNYFPGNAERMVGNSIGNSYSSTNESESVVERVLEIHQERSGDDFLLGFMESAKHMLEHSKLQQKVKSALSN